MNRVTFLTLLSFAGAFLIALGFAGAPRTSSAPKVQGRKTLPIGVYRPHLAACVGAVAAPNRYGEEVGAQILRDGGNAIDAAVAIAFTLAVTHPQAGNIGGGGFILVRHQGRHVLIDCRETAPLAGGRDMYLDDEGEVVPDKSLVGVFSVGVPGSVHGLWTAHQEFGRLPWDRLLAPAIGLARTGFVVSGELAKTISTKDAFFREHDRFETNFSRLFGHLKSGDRLIQKDLAATLERIAKEGPAGFYSGVTADLIVKQVKKLGGLITHDDLKSYRSKIRRPLHVRMDGLGIELVTVPPPSSGGVALIQMLRMTEATLGQVHAYRPNSKEYIHFVAEVEKRVFADRAHYLGDSDFVQVPIEALTRPGYCARRIRPFDPKAISPTESMRPGLESEETTHYSVLDAEGNAVSHTTTLNSSFGSGVLVEGAGFLLNNEMDDFSSKPGVPNVYGVVGAEANAVAPGKRMLSSMSPTMAYSKDGRELILGTPGGPTIFTSNYQVIMNVFHFRMNLRDAISRPRFHHQLLPKNRLDCETRPALGRRVIRDLERMGYVINVRDPLGDEHAILVDHGRRPPQVQAQSDPRGTGSARVVGKE